MAETRVRSTPSYPHGAPLDQRREDLSDAGQNWPVILRRAERRFQRRLRSSVARTKGSAKAWPHVLEFAVAQTGPRTCMSHARAITHRATRSAKRRIFSAACRSPRRCMKRGRLTSRLVSLKPTTTLVERLNTPKE